MESRYRPVRLSSDGHRPPLHHATRFNLGRPRVPAHAGPGGSPFQMPTRLADGLGPESDLGDGSPPPFAPPGLLRFGSPASTSRKAGQLRLLLNGFSSRVKKVSISRPVSTSWKGKYIYF